MRGSHYRVTRKWTFALDGEKPQPPPTHRRWDEQPHTERKPHNVTLYVSHTHPQHRPIGAHRKPTRWDRLKNRWIRAPHPKGNHS